MKRVVRCRFLVQSNIQTVPQMYVTQSNVQFAQNSSELRRITKKVTNKRPRNVFKSVSNRLINSNDLKNQSQRRKLECVLLRISIQHYIASYR